MYFYKSNILILLLLFYLSIELELYLFKLVGNTIESFLLVIFSSNNRKFTLDNLIGRDSSLRSRGS